MKCSAAHNQCFYIMFNGQKNSVFWNINTIFCMFLFFLFQNNSNQEHMLRLVLQNTQDIPSCGLIKSSVILKQDSKVVFSLKKKKFLLKTANNQLCDYCCPFCYSYFMSELNQHRTFPLVGACADLIPQIYWKLKIFTTQHRLIGLMTLLTVP